jgi:tetratricopeptide (TPR) repeat protein
MPSRLAAPVLAFAFVAVSATGLIAIRAKTAESAGPKASPEALATAALNTGMKRLENGDALERSNPKGARKEFEAASKEFQTAIRYAPENYRAHNGLGYSYRKLGLYERALESYDRALTLAPSYTLAIEYRAEAYLGLNRLEDVKRAYMQLFVADRGASNVLMKAMKMWVEQRRAAPTPIDAAAIDGFDTWLRERDALAASVVNLGHNSPDWK